MTGPRSTLLSLAPAPVASCRLKLTSVMLPPTYTDQCRTCTSCLSTLAIVLGGESGKVLFRLNIFLIQYVKSCYRRSSCGRGKRLKGGASRRRRTLLHCNRTSAGASRQVTFKYVLIEGHVGLLLDGLLLLALRNGHHEDGLLREVHRGLTYLTPLSLMMCLFL